MADIFIMTSDMAATPSVMVLASNGAGEGTAAIGSLLPFLLIGLAFYFLLIRPQRKRQQEQKAMISSLGVGDDVVTIGGIHGEILDMTDDTVELLIADEVVVTIARNAVSRAQTVPAADLDDDEFDDSDVDEPAFDEPAFDDTRHNDAGRDDARGDGDIQEGDFRDRDR